MRALSVVKRLNPSASRGSGEPADRVDRLADVREEVESPVAVPGVAGQHVRARGGRQRIEIEPDAVERLLEDALEREDCGAGVHGPAAVGALAHLAARRRSTLEDGDVEPTAAEDQRRHQSADAGAHDDDVRVRHSGSPQRVWRVRHDTSVMLS